MSQRALTVPDDDAVVVYLETGGRLVLKPEVLESWTQHGPSWLRFINMVMGGPPARMKIAKSGGVTENVFVVRQEQVINGTSYADLDNRYPETSAPK